MHDGSLEQIADGDYCSIEYIEECYDRLGESMRHENVRQEARVSFLRGTSAGKWYDYKLSPYRALGTREDLQVPEDKHRLQMYEFQLERYLSRNLQCFSDRKHPIFDFISGKESLHLLPIDEKWWEIPAKDIWNVVDLANTYFPYYEKRRLRESGESICIFLFCPRPSVELYE